MSERIVIEVQDREVDDAIAKIDAAFARSQLLMGQAYEKAEAAAGWQVSEAMLFRLTPVEGTLEDLLALQPEIEETNRDLDQVLLEAAELDAVQAKVEEAKTGLADIDLPSTDRSTRMILSRIPGIREALSLLNQIRMLQQTLRLGEIRGPITAAIMAGLYAWAAVQSLLKWKEQKEAEDRRLAEDMDQRLISVEEALMRFRSERDRYRGGVSP